MKYIHVFLGFWLISIELIDVSALLSNLKPDLGYFFESCFVIGLISSILAAIFGILAIRKNTPNKHLAQAGLVLGIVVSFSLVIPSILAS